MLQTKVCNILYVVKFLGFSLFFFLFFFFPQLFQLFTNVGYYDHRIGLTLRGLKFGTGLTFEPWGVTRSPPVYFSKLLRMAQKSNL